jgi:hypothetical protein
MDELLGVDESAAAKDRPYRCLDRLRDHKDIGGPGLPFHQSMPPL